MGDKTKMSSIWEVPLANGLGFSYVRMFKGSEINEWGWFIFVYDFRSEISNFSKKNSIDWLLEYDYLCPTFFGMGKPIQRKSNFCWKKLGDIPIIDFDKIVPFTKSNTNLDSPENQFWSILHGPTEVRRGYFEYNNVKHLGESGHIPLQFLHYRLTLEWMKKLGMDYENYVVEDDSDNFLWYQKFIVKSTELYSNVPKEIRGKVLGEPAYMDYYDLPYNRHLKEEAEKEQAIINDRRVRSDKMNKELLDFYNDIGKTSRKKMIDKSIELAEKYGLNQ